MKKELPAITRLMLKLSDVVRSYGIILLAAAAGLFFAMKKYRTTQQGALFLDALSMRIPFVNTLVVQAQLTHFLQAVSMLLAGGMQLVPALKLARHTVRNSLLDKNLLEIVHEVEAGTALSSAMLQDPEQLFGLEAQALIKVGEESGKLAAMISKASILYEERVKRLLAFVTTMVQPLLVVILGLLITLLIFAVYLPVLTLSHVM